MKKKNEKKEKEKKRKKGNEKIKKEESSSLSLFSFPSFLSSFSLDFLSSFPLYNFFLDYFSPRIFWIFKKILS